MESKYKIHIKKNIDRLIHTTDYEKLMNACVQVNLLSGVMSQNIERDASFNDELNLEKVKYEKHKRLFEKLTKRGPSAYQNLKDILIQLKMDAAVRILCEPDNDDLHFISIKKNAELQRQNEERQIVEERKPIEEEPNLKNKFPYDVIKTNEIKEDNKVGTYVMQTKDHRGIFFMVNIIEFVLKDNRRDGAEEDGQAMSYIFRELGFKIYAFKNLTKADFINRLQEVLRSEECRKTECFVMALMTHGNLGEKHAERVVFHDGVLMNVVDILDLFAHYNCPNLVNKPKVFVFPFCRGEDTDRQINCPKEHTESTCSSALRTDPTIATRLSDVLICYASTRGYKAHRDPDSGNWYIQTFCKLMAKHAHDTDLDHIVKMVQNEVNSRRTENGALQIPCSENISFNKRLFFNPGCWKIADKEN